MKLDPEKLQFVLLTMPLIVVLSVVIAVWIALLSSAVGEERSLRILLHLTPSILLPSAILLTRNQKGARPILYIILSCLTAYGWSLMMNVSPVAGAIVGPALFMTLTKLNGWANPSWKAVGKGTAVGFMSMLPLIMIAGRSEQSPGIGNDMLYGIGFASFIIWWIVGIGYVIHRGR